MKIYELQEMHEAWSESKFFKTKKEVKEEVRMVKTGLAKEDRENYEFLITEHESLNKFIESIVGYEIDDIIDNRDLCKQFLNLLN